MKSTAVERTSWEKSFTSSEVFIFSPTPVLKAVLKYSDLRKARFKGHQCSVDPPHTENVGMCLDNLPVRAGEGEVGIIPVLVELPHLGDHIRLVNTHPETQCLIIRCFLRISEYVKLLLIGLKVVTNWPPRSKVRQVLISFTQLAHLSNRLSLFHLCLVKIRIGHITNGNLLTGKMIFPVTVLVYPILWWWWCSL